jgi:Predicted membrane protein (DUF2306)
VTQTDGTEVLTARAARPATKQQAPPPGAPAPNWAVRWLRNPWVIVLAAIVVFNLLWALPRYLRFDPKFSRVPLDAGFPLHFTVIVLHVIAGCLALVLVFFQLSTQLRRRFPLFHRVSGRLYIFGGALPTALLALVLVPYSHQPFGELGLYWMAALWLVTTLLGYWHVRNHRYVEHRRWMIYSFALALGTTWGRVILYAMTHIPGFTISFTALMEISSWMGWVVNLVIAHWWVQHTAKRAPELVS